MKCKSHNDDANAVCSNCGVALCNECAMQSKSGKYCCSTKCISETDFMENVANLTLERATKGAQAGAYGGYLLGVIFWGFAVYGLLKGWLGVTIYAGIFGLGLVIMGYFYQKSATAKIPVK